MIAEKCWILHEQENFMKYDINKLPPILIQKVGATVLLTLSEAVFIVISGFLGLS